MTIATFVAFSKTTQSFEPFERLHAQQVANKLATTLLVVRRVSPAQVPVVCGRTATLSFCRHISCRNVRIAGAAVKKQAVFTRAIFVLAGKMSRSFAAMTLKG